MDSVTLKDLIPGLPQLQVLHYLISEIDGGFSAHCLDLDLVSVGADLQSASRELDDLVKVHIELSLATSYLKNLTTRAPKHYWDLFLAGTRVEIEPKTVHITVPETVPLKFPESELGILAHLAHAA